MPTAIINFTTNSWDEQPYLELDETSKLTETHVSYAYSGDMQGECKSESLMFYDASGVVTYTGLDYVKGTLAGKTGSFVMKNNGVYKDGIASSQLEIIPDSGTGELKGIRGTGKFDAGHADNNSLTLDYDF